MSDTNDAAAGVQDGEHDDARFQRVSEGLKHGFQLLGQAAIPPEDKPRWQQRLIAITNSSKHDLATAEARLDRFFVELEAASDA